MGEKMSLEQVKAEMWEHMGHGFPRAEDDDMQRWIDAIDAHLAHLAQPAQSAQSAAAKDAELDRLSQESAQQFIRARDWAELSGKNEDRASLAESRLAAANALLRNIAGCQWFNREAPATVELIDAYLQGVGDEATD